MVRERMARAMTDALVNKTLKDINDDPERGLRNIIDLALSYNVGSFSGELFRMIQKMLSDSTSAYYRLIKTVANNVNTDYLKGFAVNIGYNSCGKGAESIRNNEKVMEFSIPWCISFGSNCNGKWVNFASDVIRQGKTLGTYFYSIYNNMAFTPDAIKLYSENNDCAFIIFTDADALTEDILKKLSNVNNILISLKYDCSEKTVAALNLLNKYARFFSCHLIYDSSNFEKIVTEEYLKSFEIYTNSFVFFIPRFTRSMEICEKTAYTVKKIRDSQRYAYILMDMKADVNDIDKVISDRTRSIIFSQNNKVLSVEDDYIKGNYDITDFDLKELLKNL